MYYGNRIIHGTQNAYVSWAVGGFRGQVLQKKLLVQKYVVSFRMTPNAIRQKAHGKPPSLSPTPVPDEHQ